jgi:hypothetical protein
MFKNNEVSAGGFTCSENFRLPERNLFDFSKPDIFYFKVQALVFPLLKIYPNVNTETLYLGCVLMRDKLY